MVSGSPRHQSTVVTMGDSTEARMQQLGSVGEAGLGLWEHGEGNQWGQLGVEPAQGLTGALFPQRTKSGWSVTPSVLTKAPDYDHILEPRV